MRYFDYASTTPVNEEVLKTYQQVLARYFINSESIYPEGVEINNLMNKSRQLLADLLHVKEHEIIFTSGASEANNMAIKGTAFAHQNKGKHIITSCVEHSSVLNSCKWLEKYAGFEITYLPVGEDGKVSVADLKNAMREDTILVSIMYVNNESGAIMPIDEIKKVVRGYINCYLHVDCVQACGKIEIDLTDIDMASFSAHKFNGLKGSGFLMKKQHVQIAPLISGGAQEYNLRGGTANSPANMVLGKSLRIAFENMRKHATEVQKLHDYLYREIEKLDDVVMNSKFDSIPHVINFSSLKVTSQVMMNALAICGDEVSAQSTCDSGQAFSHVISQMYKDKDRLKGTIRISISHCTTRSEVDQLLKDIKETIHRYG